MKRMNKIVLTGSAIALTALTLSIPAHAITLQEKLSGRILLQVEEKGKAWYVDPATQNRAYLGRPADAFRVMRELGLGITNTDLEKIATSDAATATNTVFTKKLAGKILLQVQANGEAWYINPTDLKRYFLGRPSDAFSVMRGLGLGISNKDMGTIPTAVKYADPEQPIVAAQAQSSVTPPSTSTPSSSAPSAPTGQTPVSTPSSSAPSTTTTPTATLAQVAGSYRCYSYNVSGGGGGDCRLFAPIVLNTNGTYSVSSEKGTYTVKGDIITLSESKLRGPGKLIGGTQIRFEYDYNGWHHTITYLKESGSTSTTAPSGTEVAVQLILQYPAKDSALGGIVTVELVPEGQDVKTASYKPTAIAQYDGDKRIIGSFYKATNMPKTGTKYTVYTNTGFASTAVGTLDLTTTTTETTATINVTSSGASAATQTEVQQSTAADIEVDLKLVYPTKDSSLGSMNFVTVVKQGEDPATATYKPTTTALWDGDRTIDASFWKSYNRVKTKAVYTIYTDYGYGLTAVGTLDLTSVTADPYTKTITISSQSSSGNSSTSSTATTSSSSTVTTPEKTYTNLSLLLQYSAGDQSLNNVTRIGVVKQSETYYHGYGNLAGYGEGQQLTASFPAVEIGFLYDVYTDSYTGGSKKVGVLDMRTATANTTKTISVQ